MCERERESARKSVCACVCVFCVWRSVLCVCVWEREQMCAAYVCVLCVCVVSVCERERLKGRARENM